MAAGDADELAAVFVDCIDAEALFEQQFLDCSWPAKPSAEVEECVAEAVDTGSVVQVLSASFQGRETPAFDAAAKVGRAVRRREGLRRVGCPRPSETGRTS